MGVLQCRVVRVAAGPVAGCHRRSRSGPCTRARTMSPFKWIHSLVIAAAASVAVMGGVTSAQASVVFDFVAIAAGNEGPFDNTAAYATVGGITVQAFASNTFEDEITSVSYLDDVAFIPPRPAGLGVCSLGLTSSGQCEIRRK